MPAKEKFKEYLLPVAILIVLTALFAANGLDVALERHFYQQGTWVGREANPWRFLYRYGVLPAYLSAAVGLLTFVAGFFSVKAAPWRRSALFLVLFLALGPGLLVNTVFKDHWGRPRPAQLEVFGGAEKATYHQVWERGLPGEGHSFPSGHASAAFFLIFPYFVLRRRARGYALATLAGGLAYGLFMGVARMAQGGHFPSDVLWAGGMVYLVGLALCQLLKLDEEGKNPVSHGVTEQILRKSKNG